MEKFILNANDYKQLAKQINTKIDFMNHKTMQQIDIDLYKNNNVIFIDISILLGDGMIFDFITNDIVCYDDNNNELQNNYNENILQKYI